MQAELVGQPCCSPVAGEGVAEAAQIDPVGPFAGPERARPFGGLEPSAALGADPVVQERNDPGELGNGQHRTAPGPEAVVPLPQRTVVAPKGP